MTRTTPEIDLIVVGTGWFGLSAAKHYIQLHPQDHIVVLESAGSCGGTWAQERLYPGLKSNNMVGSYEYPDFPMSEDVYGVKADNHIPAATLHRYLTDYAKHFGVFDRVQFHTRVTAVQPRSEDDGWRLHVACSNDPVNFTTTIETKRLILATGLTSLPNMPSYSGQDTFHGPVFHAKDFKREADTLTSCTRVVVVGGAKSALDVSYAYTQAGVQVYLIIRPDGNGPVWLAKPFVTPFKRKMEELLHTRCLTWFSPSPWQDEDGYSTVRSFLHGTKLGNLLVNNFWSILSADIIESNGYEDHHHPSLRALKPWYSAYWTGSGVSIHNFDTSIFDLVKEGKICIHTANITELSPRHVHLSTGETLQADAIVCATGWKKGSAIQFVDVDCRPVSDPAEMDRLLRLADDEILSRFPGLKSQPCLRTSGGAKHQQSNPWRLYRFMVPPALWERRTLAFAGMVSSVSTAICASLQGLWISAYFDGTLDRMPPTQQAVVHEAVINSVWGKWRYPCGYGEDVADFAFDALPYFDLLLKDLGLKHHRKSSATSELTEPYKPWDYQDVVEEWKQGHWLFSLAGVP
ncbi:FAD/NAD(P)-binding domain-containing protein [Aspergillus japonicus CBS 114.51]|uniref:FAD/NAD(P)-binding domain-containing protein n=1 Tax=Aspergillus japonicus CBS 114.51 TaxID=1448312 RepID=A0A8T8WSV9_ASPJA|nr:FAD/NAD(P)-binding domain-containing protein [Aspergillus japonicus CBS 114.51]RAH78907.1 FAD/NAD(P)-binding domain-containing protein [Aspergillus japonicus CBS 114.51]